MAPTSDERREVAERLKEYATGFDFGDSNPWWYVQKAVFGDVIAHDTSDAFALLADLIDPTCEVNSVETCCNELGQLEGWEFRLTCGHSVKRPYNEAPAYCPHCGARVVID